MAVDNHFLGLWIGRGGQTERSLQGPDLTACDFVIWAWAKQEVCWLTARTLTAVEQQIRETSAAVPIDFLMKNIESVSSGLQKCVCEKWWGLCWNITVNDSVWACDEGLEMAVQNAS